MYTQVKFIQLLTVPSNTFPFNIDTLPCKLFPGGYKDTHSHSQSFQCTCFYTNISFTFYRYFPSSSITLNQFLGALLMHLATLLMLKWPSKALRDNRVKFRPSQTCRWFCSVMSATASNVFFEVSSYIQCTVLFVHAYIHTSVVSRACRCCRPVSC